MPYYFAMDVGIGKFGWAGVILVSVIFLVSVVISSIRYDYAAMAKEIIDDEAKRLGQIDIDK